MPCSAFLTDEHVPPVFTNVLSSKGFEVTPVLEKYGEGSVDSTILADCAEEGIAVVTNDRDFVRLAAERDHAGIVVYTDRTLLLDEPVEAAEALGKIDRHYAPDSMRNTVEWLDGWV